MKKRPKITKADVEQLFYMKPGDPYFYHKRYQYTTERRAGKLHDGKYWVRIGGSRYTIGELVWAVVHGESPEYGVIHKDGDGGNWKVSNLIERPPPWKGRTPREQSLRLAERLEKAGFPASIGTGIREIVSIQEELDRLRSALTNVEHALGQFSCILSKLHDTLTESQKLA